MDAEQVEVNVLATPGPTTWEPPRDIQISLYPVRRQLITNPTGKDGTTGWGALGGTIGVSHASVDWPASTTQGFLITATTNTGIVAITTTTTQPGISYTLSFWIQQATGNTGYPSIGGIGFSSGSDTAGDQSYFNATVFWLNASDTVISSVTSILFAEDAISTFVQGNITNTVAPAGAVNAQVWISVLFPNIGDQHYIGAPLFAPESAVLPYFDATFSPSTDYLFEGTPNNSISDYYPNLPAKLSRLASVMPEYIPIGSTFSLLVGADIALAPVPPAPPIGAFYDWDDASDTWDNASDTWG